MNETRDGKKPCSRCCKLLLILCFATNPTTKALYSKCETCRPKHAKKSHAKRDAEVAEKKATIEAMLESGELVRCQDCGPKPLESFATNPTTGKPFTRCKPCNVTKNAASAEYQQTEAGKATAKRAKTSDKGKASQKRAKTSKKGKASARRFSDRRTERRRESTAMRMDNAIMCLANHLISGRCMTSPKFLQRTSFASEQEFFDVLEATFASGMDFKNHGAVWEVEHKIPREAYDFDDPEDVKRCWSVKNVHVMTVAANDGKSWKLIDEYITSAGVENFPKAWNNKFPDAAFKAAHNAKMLAQKAIDDEEAASEQPSGSNDVGPMDDSD